MIPAVRGTHDILPGQVERWQRVERIARGLCERYGYVEVRTPIIEREELFAKGTGDTTDIVQKEMYSFTDKGGERITLRPEATPSMVRAYVEHSLEHALPSAKLYAMGPMFRYERPQKGRYRQFHQLDVEVFGLSDPAVDAEVIDLAWSLLEIVLDVRAHHAGRRFGPKRHALSAFIGEAVHLLLDDVRRLAGAFGEEILALENWRSHFKIAVALAESARDALDELPLLDLPRQDVVCASNC